MALPKYYEFYGSFLKELADGEIHEYKDIKSGVVQSMGLTADEITEKLPSGKQTVFDNRIGWARTYLKKAGLVLSPSKAHFMLSDEGKKALQDVDRIDDAYLMQYKTFQNFINRNDSAKGQELVDNADKSPEEVLEDAFNAVNASLEDDLMTEVMKLSYIDFEHLVVSLLKKMGYGNGLEEGYKVTQPTNDGGIDGIISEDQLGFSSIYIQAKQWNPERKVDKPEIQKFVGALHEHKGVKGLFITTASFTQGAKDSARSAGIVLVDGKQLMKLMIKFNLGVSTEHIYEVKKIDSDFFAEGF